MKQLQLFPQSDIIRAIIRVSKPMKYTVKDLQSDFPDDDACLEWLVNFLYPNGTTCGKCDKVTKHYKDAKRKSYSCGECGNHMHPMVGTIFHNSHVPLTDWFHAIYLMSTNKAGTSAMQIQRELGVAYCTAWRMMHQIRTMMEPPKRQLEGVVEVDETYIHPNVFKRSSARKKYGRTGNRAGIIVYGAVERGGSVITRIIPTPQYKDLIPTVTATVEQGTMIYTDGWRAYRYLRPRGFKHASVNHSSGEYVRGDVSTQTIEGFWSTWKPRMKGTFRHVSTKYLQNYANEYAWRYSNRHRTSMFWALMTKVSK